MGSEANDMVKQAVEATLNGDTDLAEIVIAADDRIDAFERSAIHRTVVALLQEAPVAEDLRFLVSTLGIVGEIEKVGDHAVKLARRSSKLSGQFPSEMRLALLEMGDAVRKCFAASLRLYTDFSPALASEIVRGDQAIDTAYVTARDRLFGLIRLNPEATAHLVRTIECFHALEHVADNAVAIANRLTMVNGR